MQPTDTNEERIQYLAGQSNLIQAAKLLGGKYLAPNRDEHLIILPDTRTLCVSKGWVDYVWPWRAEPALPAPVPPNLAQAKPLALARLLAAYAVATADQWDAAVEAGYTRTPNYKTDP
jgi:hypothetical protein